MEELRNKLRKRFEPKPKKVRFRISSAYSGRVLKQVYEDGSESEELEEESSHGKLKSQLSEGFRMGRAEWGKQECWHPISPSSSCPRTQRINVFRDGNRYSVTGSQNLFTDLTATHPSPSNILNFGKIIIYTDNLRIIRRPLTQKELISKLLQTQLTPENAADLDRKEDEGKNEKQFMTAEEDESEPMCLHCDGARCVPCSLCHGSKLSMFANRFKESFRAIRCPGCDENGMQPCLSCAQ